MTPACASARFHAIQTDERFPSVLDVLLRHGFATGDRSDPAWLEKALYVARLSLGSGLHSSKEFQQ